MRFGYCLNMVASGPDRTGMEHLEALARIGYDYVELPCAEMLALPAAEFHQLRARLSDIGIRCEASNNFFPPSMRLTGPDADGAKVDAYVSRALERLQQLGVETLVFGSGGAKNVPDGFPREEGYLQVVRMLRRIAPMLAKAGVTLAIEPLRAQECNLINTFEEGVRLAEDVGSDSVRVLVDYYHLREANEPTAHIARYGRGMLRHIHFARQLGRVCPQSPQEDEHYQDFVRAVDAVDYDDRWSCEAYSDNFEADAGRTLDVFKTLVGKGR